jgi:hypothetical protein
MIRGRHQVSGQPRRVWADPDDTKATRNGLGEALILVASAGPGEIFVGRKNDCAGPLVVAVQVATAGPGFTGDIGYPGLANVSDPRGVWRDNEADGARRGDVSDTKAGGIAGCRKHDRCGKLRGVGKRLRLVIGEWGKLVNVDLAFYLGRGDRLLVQRRDHRPPAADA